ncbi:hypothetical protein NCLIV_047560 [Neospora caninum Liverpool]|uniref:Pre-rRNA processing protein n=1 Tax=Neospora caninum (strain Liverpool) TaxID=572307 RepID=F0VM47_NEOCL|nr:hypothetical protein NCLIV_047560 [Neospora caninum Liverpool]CBZ54325.1 hypothetical protein NCLIV_047560 [Neospora caninum Liverpool]CEL69030.1 TPA: pre-rRNA processing protein [Neospora caninum Liverpool]|eukprot:XP_003884356.1 hypothetical protein NCLIV_047560 [Neospora caninum Liverpool]
MAQTHRGRSGLSLTSVLPEEADFPRAAPRHLSSSNSGASSQTSRSASSTSRPGKGQQPARAASASRGPASSSAQYAPFSSSFPATPSAFSPAALAGEVRRREKLSSAQKDRGLRADPDSGVCSPQSGEHLERLVRPVEAGDVSPGSLLLGVVAEIHANELIVHLPYGMMGYVPRTQAQEATPGSTPGASASYGRAVSEAEDFEGDATWEANAARGRGSKAAGGHPNMLPLTRSHFVGQIVQTVVLGGGREGRNVEGEGDAHRRSPQSSSVLLLSLRPSLFNAGLSLDALAPSMVVPASIAAVEEHGYMLSFGVHELSGFLRFPPQSPPAGERLPLHSVVSVRVDKVNQPAKVVICSLPGDGEAEMVSASEADGAPTAGSRKERETKEAILEKKRGEAAAEGRKAETRDAPLPLKASLDWTAVKPGLLVQAKVAQLVRQRDLTTAEARRHGKQEKRERKRRGASAEGDRELRLAEEVRALTVTCLNGLPGVVLQAHLGNPLELPAPQASSLDKKGVKRPNAKDAPVSEASSASSSAATTSEDLEAILQRYEAHVDALQGRIVVGRVVAALPDVRRVYICLLPHLVAWRPSDASLALSRPGAFLRGASCVVQTPLSQAGDLRALLAVSAPGSQPHTEEAAKGEACEGSTGAASAAAVDARLVLVRIPARFGTHANAAWRKKGKDGNGAAALLTPGGLLGPGAECRVLFVDRFLGEIVAGNASAVLKDKLLTPFDLEAGDFVLGSVTKILFGRGERDAERKQKADGRDGVVVSLSPHLSAFVPLYQLSDVPLSTMPAFVSIGATLKLRVISRVCCASCSALDGPMNKNFFYFFPSAPLPHPGAAAAYSLARRHGSGVMVSGGGGRVRLFLTAKKSLLQQAERPLSFLTKELTCACDLPHDPLEGGAPGDSLVCAPAGSLVEGAIVTAYIGEVKAARAGGAPNKGRDRHELPFVSLVFLGGLKAQLTKDQVARAVQEGRSLTVGALMKVRILSINCMRRSFRVSLDLGGLTGDAASKSGADRGRPLSHLSSLKTGFAVLRRNAYILAITEEGVFVALRSSAGSDGAAETDEPRGQKAEKKAKGEKNGKKQTGGNPEDGSGSPPVLAFVPKLHLSDEVRLAEELCSLMKVGSNLPFDAVVLSPAAAVRPGAPVQLWREDATEGLSRADGLEDSRVAQVAKLLARELEQKDEDQTSTERVVRDVCLLSCKPSLRKSASDGSFVTGSSSLAVMAGAKSGQPRVLFGYVRRVGGFGLLVSFGAWQLTGLVPHSYISDSFVEGDAHLHRLYREGMTVRACVVSVHEKAEAGTQAPALAAGKAEGAQEPARRASKTGGATSGEAEDRQCKGKPLQFVVDIRPRRLSVLQRQEASGEAETKRARGTLGIDMLSSLLDQRELAAQLGRAPGGESRGKPSHGAETASWGMNAFHVGQLVEGRVTQVLPNCLLVALESPVSRASTCGEEARRAAGDGDSADEVAKAAAPAATGVVLEHQLPEGETMDSLSQRQAAQISKTGQGLKMTFVTLDVDWVTGIIDLSCRRRLIEPLEKVRNALLQAAADGRMYAHFALHGSGLARTTDSTESKPKTGDRDGPNAQRASGAKGESKKKGLPGGDAHSESVITEPLPTSLLSAASHAKQSSKKQKRSRSSGEADLEPPSEPRAWELPRQLLPPRVLARIHELCVASPPSSAEVQVENAAYAVLVADFALTLTISSSPAPAASKGSLTVNLPLFLFTLSCRNNTLQPCQLSSAAFDTPGPSAASAQAAHATAASVSLSRFLARHPSSGVLLADCCWERHQQALIEAQQKRGTRSKNRFVRDQLQKVLRGESPSSFAHPWDGPGAGSDAGRGLRGQALSSVEDVEKDVTVGKLLRCRVTAVGPTVALARLKKPKKALLIRLHAANAVAGSPMTPALGACITPFKHLHPGSIVDVRVLRLHRDEGAPAEAKQVRREKRQEQAADAEDSDSGDEPQAASATRKNEWTADVELVPQPSARALDAADDALKRRRSENEGKRSRAEIEAEDPRWAVVEHVGPRGLKIHCGVREAALPAPGDGDSAAPSKKRKLARCAAASSEVRMGGFAGGEERGRIEWGDTVRGAAQEAPQKQYKVGEVLSVMPLPVVACTRAVFEEALGKFAAKKNNENGDETESGGPGERKGSGRTLLRTYAVVTQAEGGDKRSHSKLSCAPVPRPLREVFTSLPAALSAWSAWRFPPNAVCWGVVHHFLSAPFAVAVQLSSVALSPRDGEATRPSLRTSGGSTDTHELVQLPILAAVHVAEVLDDWVSDPVKRLDLKVGQAVKVKILPIAQRGENGRTDKTASRSGLPLEASLRLSQVEAKEGLRSDALRSGDLRSDALRFENLEVGQEVSGLVVSSGQAGVFVAVSRSLTLRIKLQKLLSENAGATTPAKTRGTEAAESPAGVVASRLVTGDEAKALFPVGRLVQNIRIVALDPETRRIEGSLRPSSVKKRTDGEGADGTGETGESAKAHQKDEKARPGFENLTARADSEAKRTANRLLEKLNVGDVIDGRVRGLETFGVFVRLEDGEDGDQDRISLDVLCHVSEMGGNDWQEKRARLQRLQKGDLVRGRVTKIDRAQGKAWISLDAEVFDSEEGASEEEDLLALAGEESSDEDMTGLDRPHATRKNRQAMEVDFEDEGRKKKHREAGKQEGSEDESPGAVDGGDSSADEGEEAGGSWSAGISASAHSWGWSETGPSANEGGANGESDVLMSDSEGELDTTQPDLNDADEDDEKKSKAARRRHEEEARRQEEETRRLEDNAGRSWMEDPRSPEDFERLVLVNGNSAAVWIRQVEISGDSAHAESRRRQAMNYMAYYLKLNELQMARQVAERAIQHINYREEQERSSVWIAYLNLECVYGDRVDEIFKRAVQYNDSKKIHYQMTFIYEKARQLDKARQMCEKCCEKFPESQKMWVRHLTLLYTALDAASAARDLMLQALFRLPRRKHIEFVATCARLEYKHGSKERGQTYFEKLLAEHPKRTDIWSQYVDAHIAAHTPPRCVPANLQSIRVLFERTTSLQLKLRKMKFFFTRWLGFEKQHGTAETQARVRAKARQFVQSVENKIRQES